jgi:hypothetical protein
VVSVIASSDGDRATHLELPILAPTDVVPAASNDVMLWVAYRTAWSYTASPGSSQWLPTCGHGTLDTNGIKLGECACRASVACRWWVVVGGGVFCVCVWGGGGGQKDHEWSDSHSPHDAPWRR